jgi:hypothetical protein
MMITSPMTPADLPKEFWSSIGIDPAGIEKIVITIEVGSPVLVEIKKTLLAP